MPVPGREIIMTKSQKIICFVLTAAVCCLGCSGLRSTEQEPVIGVKIYEHQGGFTSLFRQWHNMGINTVFTSAALDADISFREAAEEYSIDRFIILPVFYNPEFLKEHPENYARTSEGKPAVDGWVEFVCPTQTDYRNRLKADIRKLVRIHDPDGISIDFIRFFVFWEMVYPDTSPEDLPMTCFCPRCVSVFCKYTGIELPWGISTEDTQETARWILSNHAVQWNTWRMDLIAEAVQEITATAREVKPDIKFNLHAVPWRLGDFDSAAERVAAQDIARLSELVDFISPMCYAHMVKQPPEWVNSVVQDMAARSRCPVLPSIQVAREYLSEPLPDSVFRQSLHSALKAPSQGVVLWKWERLAESESKTAIMRELLTQYTGRSINSKSGDIQ